MYAIVHLFLGRPVWVLNSDSEDFLNVSWSDLAFWKDNRFVVYSYKLWWYFNIQIGIGKDICLERL